MAEMAVSVMLESFIVAQMSYGEHLLVPAAHLKVELIKSKYTHIKINHSTSITECF